MSDPTAITRVAAIIAVVLFALLILFQLALALGAPWGRAAYGGQHAGVLPTQFRVASVVAIVVWTGVGLLVIAVIMNAITPSALERAIWLPFSLLALASTVTVALTART